MPRTINIKKHKSIAISNIPSLGIQDVQDILLQQETKEKDRLLLLLSERDNQIDELSESLDEILTQRNDNSAQVDMKIQELERMIKDDVLSKRKRLEVIKEEDESPITHHAIPKPVVRRRQSIIQQSRDIRKKEEERIQRLKESRRTRRV